MFLRRLRERCATCHRATLITGTALIVLVICGVLLAAGAAGLAWTNTEKFCIGCHEMRDNVYEEFQYTIHDLNRTGVRAVCSDCHVPREPVPMLLRKMRATFELIGHFRGVIDTREKFEDHRAMLAHRVWRRMKETDSLECRNCHKNEGMDLELQSDIAQKKHTTAREKGMTCIDCHYGIAHTEPDGPSPQELFGTADQ